MLTHTDLKHVPLSASKQRNPDLAGIWILFKLGVKQEDEVSGGLRRSGDVVFGPSHVIGDTQQGKKGRGRLLLKFDIGSFHFYSITYHSRSQRIAV